MRPLRLDLAGFTVFREPTVVDFTDADFFALVGPTGSGKSTVLDAICFALYGTVPRWSDRRAIANALSPSAGEARVRLVFEAAGSRYAATRVVRRDGKGRVATSHAGLELLPPGFDLSTLANGLTELGEPLAGTPAEMDAAVLEAVGLPYDQFTTCVVLPQGAFAEFLHAKPAARQQILVNLLGLSVYEKIREQAGELATRADADLAATDRQLAELADATAEAELAAIDRLATLQELVHAVEQAVPRLEAARRAARDSHSVLDGLDEELAALRTVQAPAGLAEVAGQLGAAQQAAVAAADAVTAAEAQEDAARGGLAQAGDAAVLTQVLHAWAEHGTLNDQLAGLQQALAEATAQRERSAAAVTLAGEHVHAARAEVEAAREAAEQARTADRAATLRPHLSLGEPCPVCDQTVAVLPPVPHAPALAAAQATVERAAAAADRAERGAEQRRRTLNELDLRLAAAAAQQEQAQTRERELAARLVGAPDPAAARAGLAAIEQAQTLLQAAGAAVRAARATHRTTEAAYRAATDQHGQAWRGFDTIRDRLARLAPPPADRDDLPGSWMALQAWAGEQGSARQQQRAAAAADHAEHAAAADRQSAEIDALFHAADVTAPGGGEPARHAAVAAERAQGALATVQTRRARTAELATARAGYASAGQVARTLANHLRANNFERWLLEGALDLLVAGASRILLELSGGQYELVHSSGEFLVIDHYDAALRRSVRTLSGGETFQASLALALALSDQLSGTFTRGASLESIVLDEGFGTLDAASLDTVAVTLENLAAQGDRMVGVVTHVSGLADRIPVRFEVRKDARTARVERVGT